MPALDMKTMEMIALSASVAANCAPCLKYHFAEAIKHGCTAEEIQEIVTVANMVKQKSAGIIVQHISPLLNELMKEKK